MLRTKKPAPIFSVPVGKLDLKFYLSHQTFPTSLSPPGTAADAAL